MLKQNEVYFFGKLNQSRDFIFSENLQTHDRFFWDDWFNRCSGQNKLISFTRKTYSPLQIWLFCIKLPDDLIYTGMAAGSSDKIGRKYPFVLFYKPSSIPESLDSLFFLLKKKNSFREILKEGEYCIEDFTVVIQQRALSSLNPFTTFYLIQTALVVFGKRLKAVTT